MNRYRRKRRRGFTLLEVMLVIGILAMLALFVVPSFIGQSAKAKLGAAKAMVGPSGPIASAISNFHMDFGKYPESLKDLIERPSDLDDDKQWTRYMETDEFKDPWHNELIYKEPGDVREDGYDLISMGPDGKEGGDDDIGNFRKEG